MATINTDIAQKIDITIRAEDSLSLVLNITNSTGGIFNLSEYYVFFNIYGSESEDSLISASNVTARNTELSGSVSNNYISNVVTDYTISLPEAVTVTDNEGKVVLTLTDTQTSLTPGSYKYKMKLKKGSTIKTWMHGKFKVNE